jgi:exodeoxyribonuclease V alpha subunit
MDHGVNASVLSAWHYRPAALAEAMHRAHYRCRPCSIWSHCTATCACGVARPDGRKSAVFERQNVLAEISPSRLGAVETVHALTIHKSQGSQADAVAVLLPDADSRILTRELLYTGVTRARRSLLVCGAEEAVRADLDRPVAHASELAARLWEEGAVETRELA